MLGTKGEIIVICPCPCPKGALSPVEETPHEERMARGEEGRGTGLGGGHEASELEQQQQINTEISTENEQRRLTIEKSSQQ